MSVHSNLQKPVLQAAETPVTVILQDGSTVSAIRVATYQINPRTGEGTIVAGTLKYLDAAGAVIPGVVRLTCCNIPQGKSVTWFGSSSGRPIYIGADGLFYNADGSVYEGDTTGYQIGGSGAVTYNNTYNWTPGEGGALAPVAGYDYAYFWLGGPRYIAVRRLTYSSVSGAPLTVNYYLNGQPVNLPDGATVVEELPPPQYKLVQQIVENNSNSVAPTDFPISGVSAEWFVMFPELGSESTDVPQVIVDDVVHYISGGVDLNSEQATSTVIAPMIAVLGNAYAEINYRLRISPVMVTEIPVITSTWAT